MFGPIASNVVGLVFLQEESSTLKVKPQQAPMQLGRGHAWINVSKRYLYMKLIRETVDLPRIIPVQRNNQRSYPCSSTD